MGRLSGPERRKLQAAQRAARNAKPTQLKGLSIGAGGFNINNKPVTTAPTGGSTPTPPTRKHTDPPPKPEAAETEPQKPDPASSSISSTPVAPEIKKEYKILRYPYAANNPDTDYLRIQILKFVPPGIGSAPKSNGNGASIISEGLNSSKSSYKNKDIIQTILLPIPQNIQAGNSVSWVDDSLNALSASATGPIIDFFRSPKILEGGGKLAKDFGGILNSLAGTGSGQRMTETALASAAVNLIPGTNTSFSGLLARTTGQILNPNKELLFNGVNLRAFNFSFDLAPRNDKEATQIKMIIRSLKQNMSAKSDSVFLDSPNVFQLTYMTGGKEHKFLNKFIVAALTSINVNYTGSGTYMTYNDGAPVHMRMDLSFQELSPVYAEDYYNLKSDEGVGY